MARMIPESIQLEKLAPIAEGRYTFERIGEYVGNKTKYLCVCLVDGHEWSAQLSGILLGSGCRKCAHATLTLSKTPAPESRAKALNALPGVKFVDWVGGYKNKNTKAVMECEVDGHRWEVSYNNVSQGGMCPRCFSAAQSARRLTPELDAIKLIADSGFQFRGWVGEYVGTSTKVIVSAACGHKWESRTSSLVNQGTGCPLCAESGFSPSKPASLYALMSECGGMVKIGISNDPERRLKRLARDTPFSWNQIAQIDSQDGAQIARFEKELHDATEQAITDAKFDGYTEWRKYNPAILETLELYSAQAV